MVIHLGEDLDHHNAVYIRELADGYVDKYPIDRIIFDFSGVEFMDSSGIALILGRVETMSAFSGRVQLKGLSITLGKLIRLSGLDRVGNLSITDN